MARRAAAGVFGARGRFNKTTMVNHRLQRWERKLATLTEGTQAYADHVAAKPAEPKTKPTAARAGKRRAKKVKWGNFKLQPR